MVDTSATAGGRLLVVDSNAHCSLGVSRLAAASTIIDPGQSPVWRRLPGWLSRTDYSVIRTLLRAQSDAGVRGDVLEIGCYAGKTSIAMGTILEVGETLYACDVFEIEPGESDNAYENRRSYSPITANDFERNYRQFCGGDLNILPMASDHLGSALKGKSFRLIHIDGSHLFHAVQDDISTALDHCGEDAWIVLDDFRAEHTPGVAAAAWAACARGRLDPKILTASKMYARPRTDAHVSPDLPPELLLPTEPQVLFGGTVQRVVAPATWNQYAWGNRRRRIADRVAARLMHRQFRRTK